MSNENRIAANHLVAGDIFHPGEFLLEEMEARGLRQIDLANQLGLSKTEINLVVHGKRGITVPMAIKLESVLDIAAETWMSLQTKFEINALKNKTAKVLKTEKVILKTIKRNAIPEL